MSYREDVAALQQQAEQKIAIARQERAHREYTERFQEIQAEYQSNREARDQAARDGDRPSWDYWDSLVEQNERDLQAFLPVMQAQPDPRAARWDAINKTYLERLNQRLGPQKAMEQFVALDGYLTRPRNPRATSLDERGCGLARNSPAYHRAAETLLEMYSHDLTGVKYDPSEKALTPDEAARISGLSPRHYNRSVQRLQQQGRLGNDE